VDFVAFVDFFELLLSPSLSVLATTEELLDAAIKASAMVLNFIITVGFRLFL